MLNFWLWHFPRLPRDSRCGILQLAPNRIGQGRGHAPATAAVGAIAACNSSDAAGRATL
jgi:hypothetical protein